MVCRDGAYIGLEDYDRAKAAYDHYIEVVFPEFRDPAVVADYERLIEVIEGRCTLMPLVTGNVNRRHQPDISSAVLGVLEPATTIVADRHRVDSEGLIWWGLAELGGWVREDTVSESVGCDTLAAQ